MPNAIVPTDPDEIPVRVVNGVSTIGLIGSLIDLTLFTTRFVAAEEGKPNSEHVVAARIRFDLEMAKATRGALDTQIALLAKPDGQAN